MKWRCLIYIYECLCARLSARHILNTAITTTLRAGSDKLTHMPKEETEAQGSKVTCSHSQGVLKPAFGLRSARLRSQTALRVWRLKTGSRFLPKRELNPSGETDSPATARITELRSLPASPGGSQASVAVAMTTSFPIITEHGGDTTKLHRQSLC